MIPEGAIQVSKEEHSYTAMLPMNHNNEQYGTLTLNV